jgi:hypothetical protein
MGTAARILMLAALTLPCGSAPGESTARDAPRIVLSRTARDSMSTAFARSNEHWNELADLNTMERMLGTIRPTQREFLGCLQGRVDGRTLWIESWVPARDMKQLQLAVTGSCDSVPRLIGTWHTHPYRADLRNLPIKERHLSAQDLETFAGSGLAAVLVMWDPDSIDAALRRPDGGVLHPAPVAIE